MELHDMFWQAQKGDLVLLKPPAAARWSFAVERDKELLVTSPVNKHNQCWITPADPKRRWHSSPILIEDLMPSNAAKEGAQP